MLKDIFELDELAKKNISKYPKKRFIYIKITKRTGKHFIGIVGPRGVGKTVLLKQIAAETPDSIFISVDCVEIENLFDLIQILSEKFNLKSFFLDEIHYYKNFEKDLKKIFDFLDVKIIFSSSVSLSLYKSSYDLSRRIKLIKLLPFSLREYIYFKNNIVLPKININEIIEKKYQQEHLNIYYLFEDYIKGQLFPFALEEIDIFPLLSNIIEKIISKDIPSIIDIKINELDILFKVLKFIGRSSIDGINYSSISRNLQITKYKAELYLKLLEKAFLINIIFPTGTNVLKEPKVLMNLPYRLIYNDFISSIGALREEFFVETMRMINCEFYYLKSKRGAKTPDYLVKTENEDIVIEIGGKGKGREQFKGIEKKKKLILSHSLEDKGLKRPLHLIGFLS